MLNVSFIKYKLVNISDQRILDGDEFHMRALDNGVYAAAEEAKLTDLSPAGRELQLAAGEMSSNEHNPQPKNSSGGFKNKQRDDFLSASKVRKVRRFVFPLSERESLRPGGLGSPALSFMSLLSNLA